MMHQILHVRQKLIESAIFWIARVKYLSTQALSCQEFPTSYRCNNRKQIPSTRFCVGCSWVIKNFRPRTVVTTELPTSYRCNKVGRGRFMKIGLTRFKLQTYFLMSRPNLGLTRFKLQTYFLMSRPNLGLTRLDYSIQ